MDTLAQKEKKKYEKLWSERTYRECSLGEMFFPHFWGFFHKEVKEGDCLIDFGCGCARVAREFLHKGFNVQLVDFCSNCLDESVEALIHLFSERIQFHEACLWSLPQEIKKAEWIYCCDVLEHIPESHMDLVLAGMAERTLKGGYLSICLQEDLAGKQVNETLHLTVKPKEWWKEKLSLYWEIAEEIPFLEGVYLNCCIKKKIIL